MDSINYNLSGTVFDIQRFSLHDGPGIRTIVFLNGCPMSCQWCSNPESQTIKPIVMYKSSDCINCGRCIKVCKVNAISTSNPSFIDRDKCTACGECVNACPTGALVLKGHNMTVEQLIRELKKDATTFRRSGGGVTISGGEPLVQYEFASELLKACKAQGYTTAMETTGFGSDEAIETVIPYVDTVLLDIKSIDNRLHKEFIGVSNELILQNAIRISEISDTTIRVPVVPNFNFSKKSIEDIANFACTLHGVKKIHLLPYHTFGENKYDLIGRKYFLEDIKPLKAQDLEEYKKIVENKGFQCVIGG
ncbi:MAG: glycyl-radical enzyme activating protein [Lachnospirales bacterium]